MRERLRGSFAQPRTNVDLKDKRRNLSRNLGPPGESSSAGSGRSLHRISGPCWSTIYDGLMRGPIPSLFGDEGSVSELDRLRALTEASLSQWPGAGRELQWTLLSGDLASHQGQLAEITIPAPGLLSRYPTELHTQNAPRC